MFKLKIIFLATILASVLVISSCTQSTIINANELISNPEKFKIESSNHVDYLVFESYEDLENFYLKSYANSQRPYALVKIEVTDYGSTRFPLNIKYTSKGVEKTTLIYSTEYTAIVKKVAMRYSPDFPDETGKEITVLRNIYTDIDEEGNYKVYLMLDGTFPFIKGQEYYALVYIYEDGDKTYYMAVFDTFMVNNHKDFKELDEYKISGGGSKLRLDEKRTFGKIRGHESRLTN